MPITTPKIIAAVKERITSPPNMNSASNASSVVSDVMVVRDSVWLIDSLRSCGSDIFLYRRRFSRTRS